jgi:hypothetical protein
LRLNLTQLERSMHWPTLWYDLILPYALMPGKQVNQIYRPVRRRFSDQDIISDHHGDQCDDNVKSQPGYFHFALPCILPILKYNSLLSGFNKTELLFGHSCSTSCSVVVLKRLPGFSWLCRSRVSWCTASAAARTRTESRSVDSGRGGKRDAVIYLSN